MARSRLSIVLVSMAVLVAFGFLTEDAVAQCTPDPTNHGLRVNDSNDLQASSWSGAGLLKAWVQGGFGSFRIYSWGRSSSVRFGSQRALGAVLRERRGLLR
jgi:hypothetical protein